MRPFQDFRRTRPRKTELRNTFLLLPSTENTSLAPKQTECLQLGALKPTFSVSHVGLHSCFQIAHPWHMMISDNRTSQETEEWRSTCPTQFLASNRTWTQTHSDRLLNTEKNILQTHKRPRFSKLGLLIQVAGNLLFVCCCERVQVRMCFRSVLRLNLCSTDVRLSRHVLRQCGCPETTRCHGVLSENSYEDLRDSPRRDCPRKWVWGLRIEGTRSVWVPRMCFQYS